LVDWNVVPGSTKILIQEHVVLGEIMYTWNHVSGRRQHHSVSRVLGKIKQRRKHFNITKII